MYHYEYLALGTAVLSAGFVAALLVASGAIVYYIFVEE